MRPSLGTLPAPQALVLDLDGTLADTVGQRIEAWLRTFAEVRLAADRDHVARLIGSDGRRLAREVAGVSGHVLDDEQAEAIDRRAGELYSQLNTDPRPLPGARPLLRALERGRLRWAIATSSRAEQVMASVDALHLSRRPMIVDGSHVSQAKPAPDLLLVAADRLAVAPGEAWCVGDATWDMLAAKAAGMVALGVPSGAVGREALFGAGADAVAGLRALHSDLRRRRLLD
ncbi:MAG: HAD family hydrolase [Chloroflexota bacterium]|nr:HAD family hydrolase [Chloroflexota bacterium]